MRAIVDGLARRLAASHGRAAERLWLHYSFALFVILGLLVLTHMMFDNVVTRGQVVASGINQTNSLVIMADELLAEADTIMGRPGKSMVTYDALLAALIDAAAQPIDIIMEDDATLSAEMAKVWSELDAFIATAREFSLAAPADRTEHYIAMKAAYSIGGLHRQLLEHGVILSGVLSTGSQRVTNLQIILLSASLLVIIAEALLIFWPAHHAVQTTIAKMQKQTAKLRASQTELVRANARLQHVVDHDPLTGLQNRTAMTKYLSRTLDENLIDGWSLLFIGLDGFKLINESYGHDVGDALLVAVGDTLRSCVDDEVMAARVGGDEFVLLTNEPAVQLIKRVTGTMLDPFEIDGRRILLSQTIGHLVIDEKTQSASDLLDNAEFAMRQAKRGGGNRTMAYAPALREDFDMQQRLQMELSTAIRNGEIEPWFQPQMRLADGTLHGAEVLVRWRHPSRGILTPDTFLPAATRAGLIADLDHAVWTRAMQLAQEWQTGQIWHPVISLNAAPDTIADPLLIERFLLTVQKTGLNADQVVIEVLEDTLIGQKDDIAALNIDSLAEAGIKLELDDFGTGYGSLSKLAQWPIAGIKLDRSLVSLLPDQTADSVVRAMLALATELGLHVIAEGIEEPTQAQHLSERGCNYGQGYGFGRPMPAEEFQAWLRAHSPAQTEAAARA